MFLGFLVAASAALSQSSAETATQPPIIMPERSPDIEGEPGQIMLGPIFDRPFFCSEHWLGQMPFNGDALGTDCMIGGGIDGGAGFSALYRTDGKTNDDWFGWNADVLAPISGQIVGLFVNPEVNQPGELGRPPASMVQIQSANGDIVGLAHIAEPAVKRGEWVEAGQIIGKVGNNGYSRAPHIHVGAWNRSSKVPLQIRWSLRAMADVFRNAGTQ